MLAKILCFTVKFELSKYEWFNSITNELLPLHERSLGTIYKILSSESAKSLDAKFQRLPLDHPARGPYGIFKQAASNLWGNVFIGLGSRMNVFQNNVNKERT